MNEQFMSWLASGDHSPCRFTSKGTHYVIIRVAKSSCFDYLFLQSSYREQDVQRGDSLQYAGIYSKLDGMIYDGRYDLKELIDGETMLTRCAGALSDKLKLAVRKLVEESVGNDLRSLTITELTDSSLLSSLDYAQRYGAKDEARKHYLDTVDFEPLAYACQYEPDNWTDETLLDYIADPEAFAEKEAAGYFATQQENILYSFLHDDLVQAEYDALMADPSAPVHCVKRIMTAMRSTDAKTVNVTVCKDGKELTFKTEAHPLRGDCTSYYSSWSIVAADRRRFEQAFGRHADYTPAEILRITYNRAVLYERQEEPLTYGCDICGSRRDFDNGIIWLTSSYGICQKCYDTLSEEDKERIYAEYE